MENLPLDYSKTQNRSSEQQDHHEEEAEAANLEKVNRFDLLELACLWPGCLANLTALEQALLYLRETAFEEKMEKVHLGCLNAQ